MVLHEAGLSANAKFMAGSKTKLTRTRGSTL